MTKLTLSQASIDGNAYFSDDAKSFYFRSRDGQPICNRILGIDDLRRYQSSSIHPLAEMERTFEDASEAERYVSALVDLSRMLRVSVFCADPTVSEIQKTDAAGLAARLHAKLKREDLSILETIAGFEPFRKYLDLSPEQIYAERDKISYMF